MQFVIYSFMLKLWVRLMFRHAVCNILVYVIAMGTADVQAVCDVLKREEEEEKILIDKLKELLVENKVSEQSYTKVFLYHSLWLRNIPF